jgi:uncharacterized protein YceH (UPF0502 family)
MFFILLLPFTSCKQKVNCDEVIAVVEQQHSEILELQQQNWQLQSKLDSLNSKYAEEIAFNRLAELQVKKYADIIARNPSQCVFLRGWIERAYKR